MSIELTTALIAALVSLLVALVSFVANRRSLEAQREKFERELQRRLTEKLIDRRLDAYPAAFEATAPLWKGSIFGSSTPGEPMKSTLDQLQAWSTSEGALLMSGGSLRCFYELRSLLSKAVSPGGPSIAELWDDIWRAKVSFRKSLRADVHVLYAEERWKGP